MSATREVLCNTSPLLYLHQIERLDLLPTLYGHVIVPEAVAFELSEGGRLGHAVPDVRALAWVSVVTVEQASLLRLVADLDAGEREVLALAEGRPGALLLLDDGRARRYAAMLRLRVTGTLGILLRAKERGLLESMCSTLDQLGALGFRLTPRLRATVLRTAGEQER